MGGANGKPIATVDATGPFRLVYFDIEGAGEKVRLAFVLAGIPFEDQRIKFADWASLKPKTKYGQVPILQIGETELYQSNAMLKYVGLASKSSLYPTEDPVKLVLIEEVLGLLGDFQAAWRPAFYSAIRPAALGHFEIEDEAKTALVKKLRETFMTTDFPKFMDFFTQKLQATAFICGPEPTIADCALVPQLRYFAKGVADHVPADCLKPYPAITAYIDRFLALPKVAEWYADK